MPQLYPFFIIILCYMFTCIKLAQTETYPPFIVTASKETSSLGSPRDYYYKLPTRFLDTNGDQKLKLAAENEFIEEVQLCPDLRKANKKSQNLLQSLKDEVPATTGCLFQIPSEEPVENRMCAKEPQPWLGNKMNSDGTPIICGTEGHHRLVGSEYYNCGESMGFMHYLNIDSLPHEPEPYVMYEICYDFLHKKTLWTRHEVLNAALISHNNYPYKDLNTVELDEFRTETFRLNVNKMTFADLKEIYDSKNLKLEIYTLVPKDHMALPYWKKSTTHLINSAPVFPEFLPLIKAIHNGILKASIYADLVLKQKLKIYTKADTEVSRLSGFKQSVDFTEALFHLVPNLIVNYFKPNKWYWLLHNESDQSGVLIVLNNTKELFPQPKECKDNKIVKCDFKNWSEEPNLIADYGLKHAYCCAISPEKVEELFMIESFPIKGVFQIQTILDTMNKNLGKTQQQSPQKGGANSSLFWGVNTP